MVRWYPPARWVATYYVRDEKLLFCIGDVSGKGAASAMLMGVMHSLFRAISAHENNPARIMQSINEESCRGNDSNQFVTLFIGVLDLPTGHLYYCDAGHDAPIILENGQLRHETCKPHLPVGVFADVKYEVQKTTLVPGSTLFLYTDGLTEARSEQREFFGLSRVEAVLQTCGTLSPEGILTKVTDTVRDFMKHAEQSDDLTMLAIRYTPRVFESTLSETLVITNRVEEVAKYTDFMKSVMERLQLDTSFARQLRLAVEEALVNVIDYAYPSEIEGNIELHIMSDGHTLKTVIKDYGVAFDPTTQQMADTSLSAEERQIGGLGILLVRELMDLEEIDGKYVATLVGEMDTLAAQQTEKILKPLYNSNGKDVIIECENLEYIASSGLRILLGILKGAKAQGSQVTLRHVNDDIKNVFRLTGFISIFEFE